MRKFSKIIRFVLVALVLIILGFWVYYESHQPQLKGSLKIEGLNKNVDVYYDDFGVPHIYAENAADAYRAFGYTHAADRLFQMELMRRIGNGRLSELFGAEFKKTDAFFRTIGTNRKAADDATKFENLPKALKDALNAYIGGINEYINHGKLPIEYKLLGFSPREFTIEDMYAIEGYMAYSFAFSLRTDPLIEQIYHRLGMGYLKDFDLGYPAGVGLYTDTVRTDSTKHGLLKSSKFPKDSIVISLLNTKFLDDLPAPVLEGSNNWVLGPSRTLSSKVIFANDTHIKYASPSVWYEAHIEYPGFAIYGNFLAGVPLAIIGHSRNHAWGITMFEEDDSDFFNEKFLKSDSSATVYNDSLTRPVYKIEEHILVDDGEDTTITVYNTVHGPIINSFLNSEFDTPVSMYWNYTHIDNKLVEAFYRMNHAIGIDNFREGVRMIGAPGLNIAYGDAAGNIAIWSASKLIKRSEGNFGKRFENGFSSADNYLGFYPFSENPQSENPVNGYLYSANQYHDSTMGIPYPGYYAPNTRYDRIGSRLGTMFPATVDSVKKLSTDVYSMTAAKLSHEIARVIKANGTALSDYESSCLKLLTDWDGNHRLSNEEPTLYYSVLYYILRKTMLDEMGNDLFQSLQGTHLLIRTYPKLLFQNDSKWWDNVKTSGKIETRSEIFVEAFKKAVDRTREQLGDDVTEWQWERVHFVLHPHPFGKKELLSSLFNVGPFPAPGGIETVNNSSFKLNGDGKYTADFGPAMRIIIDFADVENAVSILPTGNSGNILSPHYRDQAEMYVAGKFRKMRMNKAQIDSVSTLLKLIPK